MVLILNSCLSLSILVTILINWCGLINNVSFPLIVMIVFLLHAYVIGKIEKLRSTFLLVGSLVFLAFCTSYWLGFPDSLAHLYPLYTDYIEPAVNSFVILMFVSIYLVLLGPYLIIEMFAAISKFMENRVNEFIKKATGIIFILSLIMMCVFSLIVFSQLGSSTYIDKLSNYLFPILGVSLLYVHGKYIVSYLNDRFNKKITWYLLLFFVDYLN